MTTRRGFVQAAIAGLATPALSKFAAAEDAWPSRPIHALIPFSAGSSVDIVGRVVQMGIQGSPEDTYRQSLRLHRMLMSQPTSPWLTLKLR